MYGGVSQVDTWDPKPELTKRNGQPMPNLDNDPLFKVRNPGTLLGVAAQVRQARPVPASRCPICIRTWRGCVDDLAIIRGTYADSFAHGSGLLQMNTGFLRQGYPSLGSWVTLRPGHGQPRTCRLSW